jgi:hypothetical protein
MKDMSDFDIAAGDFARFVAQQGYQPRYVGPCPILCCFGGDDSSFGSPI